MKTAITALTIPRFDLRKLNVRFDLQKLRMSFRSSASIIRAGGLVPRKPPALALKPPIDPMLAKPAEAMPVGDYLYEPKWDGFRALVFRSELQAKLLERVAKNCVLDGEIVIATSQGLDFDALQLRLQSSASRVEKLARDTPAAFIAFDLLAVGSRNLLALPQANRREELARLLEGVEPPIYITPMTRDRKLALGWLKRFEGAGLDGVVAKAAGAAYQPGKRAMIKMKHIRTADCVVAGFRWHKCGEDAVGSLLLGLYSRVFCVARACSKQLKSFVTESWLVRKSWPTRRVTVSYNEGQVSLTKGSRPLTVLALKHRETARKSCGADHQSPTGAIGTLAFSMLECVTGWPTGRGLIRGVRRPRYTSRRARRPSLSIRSRNTTQASMNPATLCVIST